MPATDFAALGRTILSLRRDQVHAMDGIHDRDAESSAGESDADLFQKHVADRFQDLASAADLLSLSWIRLLLDAFLSCQGEFHAILLGRRASLSRSPLDRMIAEYFDRTVKALDVCNAIRDGIDQIRQWQKHLDIVGCALGGSVSGNRLGEGQFRRAKKALTELAILMLDEKEGSSGGGTGLLAHRNRSFGRATAGKEHHRTIGHFRSLSWSVSRSWSAARQLQSIGSNLSAPRPSDIVATGGLAVPLFTMNSVLLFTMWALVAAIPCQDRGLNAHFSSSRHFPWATPIISLHERIFEESKKRDRKNSIGLLKEIHRIERCCRHMTDLLDGMQFPLREERELEVRQGMQELSNVCKALNEGLNPLERQVRDVFHIIVRSRTEGLECLSKSNHSE